MMGLWLVEFAASVWMAGFLMLVGWAVTGSPGLGVLVGLLAYLAVLAFLIVALSVHRLVTRGRK